MNDESPDEGASAVSDEGTTRTIAHGSVSSLGARVSHRRSKLSPWAELYGEMCRSEARERKLTPAEYRELVRLRGGQAVEALTAAHHANLERSVRVLAYPDLTERLGDIIGPHRAARWNGWVPPRTDPEDACPGCATGGDCWRGHPPALNTSPHRAAIVEICQEAYARAGAEK